jgi:cell division protein FtsI/penicillin-binding protein 2
MTAALALTLAAGSALLWEQAVGVLLRERFPGPDTSYLLVEVPTGRVIAAQWPQAGEPVAAGSLVKPFTALAYGETHGFRYPEYTCRGAANGCWLPSGHGRIGISEALAQSCNAYFDALAAGVPGDAVASVALRFSIAPPPAQAPPAAWTGRAGLWQIAPLDLARAYAKLLSDPGAAVIRTGMALCARSGTAHALRGGLAKTGTAPCSHSAKAPGDGFVIATDRAAEPRHLLLVRVHSVPGAEAAASAAAMLRILREGQ